MDVMRFQFRTRSHAAENHVADLELIFEDGPLCGLKLVGGSIWRARRNGDPAEPRLYVTLPARRLGGGFYDLLRPACRDRHVVRDFKSRVISEYHAQQRESSRAALRVEAS
jgi:hypothetical protein